MKNLATEALQKAGLPKATCASDAKDHRFVFKSIVGCNKDTEISVIIHGADIDKYGVLRLYDHNPNATPPVLGYVFEYIPSEARWKVIIALDSADYKLPGQLTLVQKNPIPRASATDRPVLKY